MTATPVQATVNETAAALRKALRAAYPATKFSVRMSTGTAHGWLDVTYTDGPTHDQVRAVTDPFESSRFDGMSDAYIATGVTAWTCRGVNITRHLSEEYLAAAMTLVDRTNDGDLYIATDTRVFTSPYPGDTARDVAAAYCRATPAT